tara:strand:+ start:1161 stop:2123 length:963 start_codon:yes stop_codon:yes gene_type:complete
MSVLVFAQTWDGKFKKGTYEAVTYAHETAKKLNLNTIAVTIGNVQDDLEKLGNYGIEKVISIKDNINDCNNQKLADALMQVAKQENSKIIILLNSNTGKTIGPRLSIKLNASYISNVIDTPNEKDNLIVKKKAFSGKAYEFSKSNSEKTILSLAPQSFKIFETGGKAEIEIFDYKKSENKLNSKSIDKATGKISLAEAEIIVSAGRGLKGPENWEMIENLAEILNAGTACSKPVSDIGWRPHSEHVGQTGKVVSPNLYIAIGISGAIQHLAGVNSSKTMVVINKDPDAPFFKSADYGIVGDAFEVIPRLIEEIRNFKENN